MNDIKEIVNEYQPILALNNMISSVDAEKRASKFLHVLALLADWKHLLSNEKIRLSSVQIAVFSEELSKGENKTMTENKVKAEAAPRYIKAREDLEKIDNDLSYIRAYVDIFMAAHIFYRQLAKNEGL